jgi:hypothetical protein
VYPRPNASVVVAAALAAAVAGCSHGAIASGSAMSCSTYNTVNSNPDQYTANTQAVSDLLMAHGINPAGNHHYNAAGGDYVMNVTVASDEVTNYCASNPGSTIDNGVQWSNFKA